MSDPQSNPAPEPTNIQSEWVVEYLEQQRAERKAAEEEFNNSPFAALLYELFPNIDQYMYREPELTDEEFAEFKEQMAAQQAERDRKHPRNP